MSKKIIAIVPAAGVGTRARRGGSVLLSATVPKQYALIGGEPMLRRTVQALLREPRISQIRVIVSSEDTWVESCLQGMERTVWRHCGGETRAQTVQQALEDLRADDDTWALVHDAARPGVPVEDLDRLISTCVEQDQGGLLAWPVTDTVKRQAPLQEDRLARSEKTVDREGLWLAQTPQMFKANFLLQCLQKAQQDGAEITDEASAVERQGVQPLLVAGSKRNLKVTWPEDFELMDRWL